MQHLINATILSAPTFTQLSLLILFEHLCASTEFTNLLIFYDNTTRPLAETILSHRCSTSLTPQHANVMYNLDDNTIIDISKYPNAGLAERDRFSAGFARSISIDMFADQDTMRIRGFRIAMERLNIHTKWIRIVLRSPSPATSLSSRFGIRLPFRSPHRYLVVVVLPSLSDDSNANGMDVYTYNYQKRHLLHLNNNNNGTIGTPPLFYDERINMLGKNLYMTGQMDAPNLVRAIQSTGHGRQRVVGLSGVYAAIGVMIGKYYNASVAITPSKTAVASTELFMGHRRHNGAAAIRPMYEAYERLYLRQYHTDVLLPESDPSWHGSIDLYDEFTAIGHAMYPHRQENYVVLVPNRRHHHRSTELWLVLAGSPLSVVWTLAIGMFVIGRFLVRFVESRIVGGAAIQRKVGWGDMDDIALETCGMSLGISLRPTATTAGNIDGARGLTVIGRAERVLLVFVSLFATVSGVFCSGLLLQKFTFNAEKPIANRLADLDRMEPMTIVMPIGLVITQKMWNRNHTIVYSPLNVICGEILTKNTLCSYVLPESKADVLMAEEHMTEENVPVFHKLRERVFSKHMSLYTTHTIIQHSLDDLMRRLVNQGLIRHFSTESAQAMRVRRVTASAAAASASQQCGSSSITVHELRSIGVLVVLGLFASVLVFGLELLVKRLSLQRRG